MRFFLSTIIDPNGEQHGKVVVSTVEEPTNFSLPLAKVGIVEGVANIDEAVEIVSKSTGLITIAWES